MTSFGRVLKLTPAKRPTCAILLADVGFPSDFMPVSLPSRRLTAELLDSLPPDSADARHSRADLRFINRCMGNPDWIVRRLHSLLRPGEAILELGAGDGTLLERLRRDPAFAENPLAGLDRIPKPEREGWEKIGWIESDLTGDAVPPRAGVVVANLVLHHFTREELGRLGAKLAEACRARVLLACEPFRSRVHQWQAATLRLAGASAITLHDARVSIEAGFRGDELAEALGLPPERWEMAVERTWLGAYRLAAVKRGA